MAFDFSKEKIIDDKSHVYGHIYSIYNKVTKKYYIGQTLSHRLQHKRYRSFGTIGRWKDHVSEAINNTKKKQCSYLNNSIRVHGEDSFKIECILICNREQLDEYEIMFIKQYKSLYPDGYNLTFGGKGAMYIKSFLTETNTPKKQGSWNIGKTYSDERCVKISQGIDNYIQNHPERNKHISTLKVDRDLLKKISKFDSVRNNINPDINMHIRKKGSSFRVKVLNVTAFCITKHISIDQARTNAINFLLRLSNNSKDQSKDEWITRSQDSKCIPETDNDILVLYQKDLLDPSVYT